MRTDSDLLRAFAVSGSDEAFRELVQRHIDLVYGAALRQAGNAGVAEEVAQAVFLDLARKAPALVGHPVLVSWLYASTGFAVQNAMRAERRRRIRETKAYMEHELTAAHEPDWAQMREVLDRTMLELKEEDRAALLLRFFEARSFAEVASALRMSEDAARQRVSRALEKLRGRLARRGITSTAAALAAGFTAQTAMSAPAGLSAAIVSVAVAESAAVAAPATAFLTSMTMSKFVSASGVAIALLSLVNIGGAMLLWRQHRDLRSRQVPAQSSTPGAVAPSTPTRAPDPQPPAEPVAASAPTVAPKMATADAPAVRRARLKSRLDEIYTGLFRELSSRHGASGAQIEGVKEILADQTEQLAELRLSGGTDFNVQIEALERSTHDRLTSLVGVDGAAAYDHYQQTMAEHQVVESVRKLLRGSTATLSEDQAEALVNLLHAQVRSGPYLSPTNETIEAARAFLSDAQVQALRDAGREQQFEALVAQRLRLTRVSPQPQSAP